MKKIFFTIIAILFIFIIYWITLDKKVYYLVLGDEISVGITDNGVTKLNYTYYIKKYLEGHDDLERYVNNFVKEGYRVTDIINDINNNKSLIIDGRNFTLKNALIKADLVTISINNNDVMGRFNTIIDKKDLYNWIDDLSKEYEEMLKKIREYCKEEIIVLGYYYPNYLKKDIYIMDALSYLNNRFKELSGLYNIKYLNLLELFMEDSSFIDNYYPNENGHKLIGEQIINEIKKLKKKNNT